MGTAKVGATQARRKKLGWLASSITGTTDCSPMRLVTKTLLLFQIVPWRSEPCQAVSDEQQQPSVAWFEIPWLCPFVDHGHNKALAKDLRTPRPIPVVPVDLTAVVGVKFRHQFIRKIWVSNIIRWPPPRCFGEEREAAAQCFASTWVRSIISRTAPCSGCLESFHAGKG